MSYFNEAVEAVLKNEGGYSNDPDDCETNFGISKRQYPDLDIKNLTKDEAVRIYLDDYWDKNLIGHIIVKSTAMKIFDILVNVGSTQGIKITQRALRSAKWEVKEDGIMGLRTIMAINMVDQDSLNAALRSEAAGFYRTVVAANPSKKKFLQGWLKRAYG